MRNVLFIFLLLSITAAYAQKSLKGDEIKTSTGKLVIQPILHSTMALSWSDKIIYIDPYGGKGVFEGIPKPDIILITDIHGDHMNIKTLEALEAFDVEIICPLAVADKLPESFTRVVVLKNGESMQRLDLKLEAIPMYNLPESPDSRHIKGRGNGYVITFGNKRIYVSGDTEDIIEMRSLENIDIAFVCMNLPYTMTVDSAASAVLEFQPKIVYPFHYRGKPDFSDVEKFKSLVNNENINIDVRLRNWYPEK